MHELFLIKVPQTLDFKAFIPPITIMTRTPGAWYITYIDGERVDDSGPAIKVYPEGFFKEYLKAQDKFKKELTESKVQRIEGVDRYDTALKLGQVGIQKQCAAIIGSGEDFADALFTGPFTAKLDVAMYLTPKDKLADGLADTLTYLGVKFVYIVGGLASISEKVEKDLRELGINALRVASAYSFTDALSAVPYVSRLLDMGEIHGFAPVGGAGSLVFGGEKWIAPIEGEARIAGADRYETSLKILKAHLKDVTVIRNLIIISGENFPDSLAEGPFADTINGQIVLTPKDKLNPEIKKFFETLDFVENIYIIGGENSISENVEKELKEIFKQNRHK